MTDSTDLALVVGSAALVNVVYGATKGRDVVVPLVGSAVMFGGLSLVGGLTGEWKLATAFAWVFLIASLIGRGIPLIQGATALANAKPAPKGKSGPVDKSSRGSSGPNR